MILGVFRFANKMKFFTRGGICSSSRVLPGNFQFMRRPSLTELTGNDKSAADIMVHSTHCMYVCIDTDDTDDLGILMI